MILISRKLRVCLMAMGAAIALAVATVGVAFMPAVQRWVFLQKVRSWAGGVVSVDSVAIRPGSIAFRNLLFERAGTRITCADASLDMPVWQALLRHRLAVGRAIARDLKIDFTGTGLSAVAAPLARPGGPESEHFTGVLKDCRLPSGISIGTMDLEAEVRFQQGEGRPAGEVRVKVAGGGLAPGKEAKFDFAGTIVNPDPAALVEKVEMHGALRAMLGGQGVFERIGAHLEAEARGPLLPASTHLRGDFGVEKTATGEDYDIKIESPESGAKGELLSLKGSYLSGASMLAGLWKIETSDRQLAPFALGFKLPDFAIAGQGRFEVNTAKVGARLVGCLAGKVSGLDALDKRFRPVGAFRADTAFDVETGHDEVRIHSLTATVDGGGPVLSCEAVQPFFVDLRTGLVKAEDAQRDLAHIRLQKVPMAWVQPFVSWCEFGGGEVTGQLVAARRAEHNGWIRTEGPLAIRGLSVRRSGNTLLPAGDVSLDAEVEHAVDDLRVRLGAFVVTTPEGDRITLQGDWTVKGSGENRTVTVHGGFDAKLPALVAAHLPLGPIEARGSFAGSRWNDRIQIDQLNGLMTARDGTRLLELSSTEPWRYDTALREVTTVSDLPAEILRLRFASFPVRLFRRWLPGIDLNGELKEDDLVVRCEGRKLHFSASSPLRVEGLSLRTDGAAVLDNLVAELDPTIDYSRQGATGRVLALRLRNTAGASLLVAQAEASLGPDFNTPKLQGTASFNVSLPALAAQPLLGDATIPQGKLAGETKFSLEKDLLGEGRVTLNGLVAPGTGEPLPVVNLSWRAGLGARGDFALQAPLLIDRAGERSDLTFALVTQPAGGSRTIDARITSAHFVLDDAAALWRVFARPAPAANGGGGGGVAAAAAVWSGWTGQIAVSAKSFVCGRALELTTLSGAVKIAPDRLAIEKVEGAFGENGKVLLSGEARYAPGGAAPYSARMDLDMRGFEAGPLFKLLEPSRAPTIEGSFTVRWQAEGAGRTFGELFSATRGDFVLQSRKGVFRALQKTATVSRTASIMTGAARLIGLGDKMSNLVADADLTADFAGVVAEVPFDQLNVRLSHEGGQNFRLTDFTLVSPGLHLQGEGAISGEAGKALLAQPLRLTVTMGVMGSIGQTLAQTKTSLLTKERDDLGYQKLKQPFVISGSAAKPDAGQLYSLIGQSLIGSLLH